MKFNCTCTCTGYQLSYIQPSLWLLSLTTANSQDNHTHTHPHIHIRTYDTVEWLCSNCINTVINGYDYGSQVYVFLVPPGGPLCLSVCMYETRPHNAITVCQIESCVFAAKQFHNCCILVRSCPRTPAAKLFVYACFRQ